MADIIVGEKVVNKAKETGTIVSFDGEYITVDFNTRVVQLLGDSFEKGFLKYENADLQREVEEIIAQAKNVAEKKRIAEEKAKETRAKIQKELSKTHFGVAVAAASIRLDATPVNLNLVRKKDKDVIQAVFDECDKATAEVFESFDPQMKYPRYTSCSRSKYCVGFMCEYLNTYVFRVFSRNDVYKRAARIGVTVQRSDTTEILRVLCVNGKVYYFSKNLSFAGGYYNNSDSYNKWHVSESGCCIILNQVIKKCDCKYLNDYVAINNIECYQYMKLLMAALYNNKAEIVFKNKLFLSAYRIENIIDYLEEFTSKQIDFASKNNVLNALPVIKRYGLYDIAILQDMENIMRKRRDYSIYENLELLLQRLNFDCVDLGRRLINFLRKSDYFDAAVYCDYINELANRQGTTIGDFFDKDYIYRHEIMIREKEVIYNEETNTRYMQVAKELSWIDREENGYFIMVPKTIPDFRYEGDMQHNCVYACGYFERVIKRQSIIVFLREKKDTPYVTIEFDYETFDVLQALGKYNQRLDRRLHQFIVDLGKQLSFEMLSEQ